MSGATEITIDFDQEVSDVRYNGEIYGRNRRLVVTIQQYQVFSLVHGQDLTGTRIIANQKVAVQAGRAYVFFLILNY